MIVFFSVSFITEYFHILLRQEIAQSVDYSRSVRLNYNFNCFFFFHLICIFTILEYLKTFPLKFIIIYLQFKAQTVQTSDRSVHRVLLKKKLIKKRREILIKKNTIVNLSFKISLIFFVYFIVKDQSVCILLTVP